MNSAPDGWISGFIILFIALILLPLSFPEVSGESGGGVEFSRGRVNPRTANEDTEFVFTVRITSEQPLNLPVKVVIEGHQHTMTEVDPQDTNLSDGKDFEYRGKFERGPHVFFFRYGNQTTRASTFYVSHTRLIQYHPDLLIAMFLYLVPLVYIVNLLRKGTEHVERLGWHLKEIEKGVASANELDWDVHEKNGMTGGKSDQSGEGGKDT